MSGKKENSAITNKNNLFKNYRFIRFVFVVILATVGIFAYVLINNQGQPTSIGQKYGLTHKTLCDEVLLKNDELVGEEKIKEARKILQQYKSNCTESKDRSKSLLYYVRLAAIEYLDKDKHSAKNTANKVLDMHKGMSPYHRRTIVNYESMIIDMGDIVKDEYIGNGVYYN